MLQYTYTANYPIERCHEIKIYVKIHGVYKMTFKHLQKYSFLCIGSYAKQIFKKFLIEKKLFIFYE
jgi:hypothetical protein